MNNIYTCEEEPFGHYGYKSYRIEFDMTNPRAPSQRHIWTHEDGTVRVDDWILAGPYTVEELISQGYKAVPA